MEMTLGEFKKWAAGIDASDDMPMRILAFGGVRPGKAIRAASLGFDWDHGAIMLHSEQPLMVQVPNRLGTSKAAPGPRYRMMSDGDGHCYCCPIDKVEALAKAFALAEADEDFEIPEGCVEVEGNWTFTDPKVGN